MRIRKIHTSEIEAARQLLAANGWETRVSDPDRFRRLIANSQRVYVAVDGESVLGFARGICDELANGYLSMVVVHPAHRRMGVGRALVGAVMGDDPNITWVLRAGRPEEIPFFAKLGFVASTVAMERNRSRA